MHTLLSRSVTHRVGVCYQSAIFVYVQLTAASNNAVLRIAFLAALSPEAPVRHAPNIFVSGHWRLATGTIRWLPYNTPYEHVYSPQQADIGKE